MLAGDLRRQVAYSVAERAVLEQQPAISTVLRRFELDGSYASHEVASIIRPMLEDCSWIAELGHRWLGQLLSDEAPGAPIAGPLGDNGNHPIRHGVVLKNSLVQIAIQAFDTRTVNHLRSRQDSSIVELSGRLTMIRVVNGGCITADLFEFDELDEYSDVEAPRKVFGRQRLDLSKGSGILQFSGRNTAMKILSTTDNPLILIASVTQDSLPFRCLCDVESGVIKQVQASDERDNLSRMLMASLRLLQDDARSASYRDFLDHPAYFVRWNAIRELAISDGYKAAPHIRKRLQIERNPCVIRGLENLLAFLESLDEA